MKIGAIFITYNPDLFLLKKSLYSLYQQVDSLLIIDNGSDNILEIKKLVGVVKNCHIINLIDNVGIAAATNIGLKYFLNEHFDYVVLSDQDSVYSDNYIQIFYQALKETIYFRNVAVFAPCVFDKVSNQYRRFYYKKTIWLTQKHPDMDYSVVFQAIASGLIIKLSCLRDIGFMNEKLFIDSVDFEWCWRVSYFGYKIIGCKELLIFHTLGNEVCKIGKKKISVHNDLRCYYITRNTLYLALETEFLSFFDKCVLFSKACLYPILFFICSRKIKTFIICFTGFIDAFRKKMDKKLF